MISYNKYLSYLAVFTLCLSLNFSLAQEVKQDEPDVAALKNYFSRKPCISKIVYSELAGDGNTELATYVAAYCDDGFYVRRIKPGENYEALISKTNRMRDSLLVGRYKDISWQINGFGVSKSIHPNLEKPDAYVIFSENAKTILYNAIMLGTEFLEPGSAVWNGDTVKFQPSSYAKQVSELSKRFISAKELERRSVYNGTIRIENGKISKMSVSNAGCWEYEYEDSKDRPSWFPSKLYNVTMDGHFKDKDTQFIRQTNGRHCGFSFKEVHFSSEEKGINKIRFLPEGHIDTNVALITVKSNGLLISKPDLKSQKAIDIAEYELKKTRPEQSRLKYYFLNGFAIISIFGLLMLLFPAEKKGLKASAVSAGITGKLRNFVPHAYLSCCILAFVVSAIMKLSFDFSHPYMNAVDPVFFFIKSKYLLVMISIVELGVAFYLIKSILSGRPMKGVIFVLWLCTLFVLYRIAFLFSPARLGTCKCFGVGSFFGFMEEKSDFYSLILLGMMLLGGIILVLWDRSVRLREMKKI
jgi:hypothetical protein